MHRYDAGFRGGPGGPRRGPGGGGPGWPGGPAHPPGGYGPPAGGYGPPGGEFGRGQERGGRSGGFGPGGPWGGGGQHHHPYDRGIYGDAYPGFGGYPGGPQRGQHYGGGGQAPGHQGWTNRWPEGGAYRGAQGAGPAQHAGPQGGGWRGYDREVLDAEYGGGGGGGGGYAQQPFMPEEAYRRHPEYARPPAARGDRWGYELDDTGDDLDDDDVLEAVRARLYEDVWLDVDRINVEVEDGVVTLTGEVDDFLEARYAWDDAWETQGVRGVINHLAVRTDQPAEQPHGDVVPQTSQGSGQAEGSAQAAEPRLGEI